MTDQIEIPPAALNPELDISEARQTFERDGRVRVHEVLSHPTAGTLYGTLAEITPWALKYNDGSSVRYLDREDMANMPEGLRDEFMQRIFSNAANSFQYAYSAYPSEAILENPNRPTLYADDVLAFLKTDAFQDMIKEVAGLEGDFTTEAECTCFQSGHFRTIHGDVADGDRREVGFTIDMTPQWRGDWGGNLVFFDDAYNHADTFTPHFNTISIFKMPQNHAVNFVAPFAIEKRFGIDGWLVRGTGE